jgi:hypothetical protein
MVTETYHEPPLTELHFPSVATNFAVLFKPFRLLQGDDLHAQLNAFVANDSGGLLAFHVHRGPSDYGQNFLPPR